MEIFAKLSWRPQTNKEDGFRIYKDIEPLDPNKLPSPFKVLPPGTTSYTDTELVNGVTYYYLVSVFKGEYEAVATMRSFTPGGLVLGPGSQNLIGNTDTEGYFGEVTSSELITGNDLASLVGVSGGTSQNSNTNWLKFFIDDRIVFVSKKNIRNAVSWDMLNTANVINGSRIITIGQYQYKIGLLKGLGPDTSGYATNSYDNPATYGSEWNRLLYPVSIDIPTYPKTSQTIDNWANFPQDDSSDGLNISVGNGRYSWCQETDPLTPANRVFRGRSSVTHLVSSTSSITTAGYGWRVRLELITG